MLCFVVLQCAIFCVRFAVLYFVVLWCSVLCFVVPQWAVLCVVGLQCAVLCFVVVQCAVLLGYTVLCLVLLCYYVLCLVFFCYNLLCFLLCYNGLCLVFFCYNKQATTIDLFLVIKQNQHQLSMLHFTANRTRKCYVGFFCASCSLEWLFNILCITETADIWYLVVKVLLTSVFLCVFLHMMFLFFMFK